MNTPQLQTHQGLNLQDYDKTVDILQNRLKPIKAEWAIYGSYLNEKLRPGLSDIDVFVLANTQDILFPQDISKSLGDIIESAKTDIKIQIRKYTTGALSNEASCPSFYYIEEVKKSIQHGLCSQNFQANIEKSINETEKELALLIRSLEKIGEIGMILQNVSKILEKEENDISKNDIIHIKTLWESIKRVFFTCTVAMRIKKGKSVFGNTDLQILQEFENTFGTVVRGNTFIKILNDTKSFSDWYNYLKYKNGIQELSQMYDTTFIPLINQIYKYLGEETNF